MILTNDALCANPKCGHPEKDHNEPAPAFEIGSSHSRGVAATCSVMGCKCGEFIRATTMEQG